MQAMAADFRAAYPGVALEAATLHRASLLECDEDLVTAAGLPRPAGEPVSVLYSPGVPVRFGRSARPAGIPTP